MSKSGVEALTRSLAREGAPFNVLVNAVRPGVTDTGFHVKMGKNMTHRKQLIPLKRLARPEEIAKFIYFLCAENTYITSETLAIAGGE
jgi:3-oxoacyl-[acyl-carrier protein] reductase